MIKRISLAAIVATTLHASANVGEDNLWLEAHAGSYLALAEDITSTYGAISPLAGFQIGKKFRRDVGIFFEGNVTGNTAHLDGVKSTFYLLPATFGVDKKVQVTNSFEANVQIGPSVGYLYINNDTPFARNLSQFGGGGTAGANFRVKLAQKPPQTSVFFIELGTRFNLLYIPNNVEFATRNPLNVSGFKFSVGLGGEF